jgi:RNA recognition motif-containing protein
MPSKLYVGNLAYSVTQEDLEEFFSQAGTVVSAAVVMDKLSGQSRGFGFVEMADEESANRAIETLNQAELKGRRLKIDMAREGGGPGGPRGGGGGRGGRGGERGGGGRGFGKRY